MTENTASHGVCEEMVFSRLFKDNVKTLRNYLFYKFGNEEQANDIAQEAFIKLWENCSSVPFEKARPYLFTVANNASLNQLAHRKVVLNYAKNAIADHYSESPEYLLEEEQFRLKLRDAIGNLTEAQRAAFLLHRIEGKKYHEIAVMLGIGVKAVEKRIHGALVSLRLEIDGLK